MAFFPSEMSLLFVVLMGTLCSSQAHTYTVGGHDGWTLRPSQNYSDWAKEHRFQINDVLVFKYKTSHDSVLVVGKDDFMKCNKDNPIKTLKDGHSKVKFSKSGPLFFISGHNQNCEMGQKFIVVVISPHHHNSTHNAPLPLPETLPPPPVKQPSVTPTVSPTASIIAPSTHDPQYSQSPTNGAKTPSHPIEPSSNSPSPEVKTPIHTPSVDRVSQSPSPSPISHHGSPFPTTPKAESPKKRNGAHEHHRRAPAPQSYPLAYPPHHAPAPAPSTAPDHFGGSFVLLVGISFVVVLISVGFV